ncbi:MAG: thioredoxin [Defluviitaleaceae bacterium]|nr:thioredoxin [Defluviitaleaceae bacterium]
MAITMLTGNNFEEIIKKSKIPVIVDFYADWCQPCKRIVPSLEEIAAEKDGEVLVCKVNVDEDQELAIAHQIMSIPYVISYKDGEVYKRVVGAVSKEELLDLVE